MQKRNVLSSPRLLEFKRTRRRVFQNKILFYTLTLLIILALLAYFLRTSIFNITSVEIVGNKIIDTEIIKTVAEKEIAGYYFWFFPKTNIFFYPKNNIKKELANQFKRLKDITLFVEKNKVLKISLNERIGLYTWCGISPGTELIGENSKEQCYFIDKDGYVFDEAPYFSGEVYFKFYGPILESYFSPDIFSKLISFKDTLFSMGLEPVILYMQENKNIKIFLSDRTSSSKPEIILKSDSDFEKIADNLEAALTTEPLQKNLKSKYSSLKYIDLRFGNKVYYKFD
ncbi:hypothetical protein A3F19_00505 [Candidatus Nomurabacteria bacterium RIFCSPHIGHO2_12_FULL_37_29]|uniref:POTRA domain-containing protein n=2 Tax=Candidatus Nomuraibacteriota TaxID=1752729 RepID=A0A1F6Y539_9BACT|nr:MAG: hypothetical protein A3F19_00505 [Candidatus Nomurabacteria bacterium RIFCSPHIGHO2_12_FULL_37_29]OGI84646.1 MAG: hypothetical protein A3A92_02860 [Candidatus Nomurabacteria bacterium RIFCSPLOWO2_01_FULL_37_49]OGJ01462.1 MAG: hypothetical protein A3G98_00935 [Candidatus Nomurabacteria bacterium RIFCSPLOWO2_12_FULL_37_8]